LRLWDRRDGRLGLDGYLEAETVPRSGR
jgi:hypothetical protein